MSNLSFSVALNMVTDNFKAGANQIKSSLNTIKSTALQVASVFGLGLGIKATINKMIDVAKETGRVNKELKFASKSVEDFAKNQEFLSNVSNKYKVNLNIITDSFSKYTQAANIAGISIKDQKVLFEGLVGVQKKSAMSNEEFNTMLDGMSKLFMKNNIQIKPLMATFANTPQLLGIMSQSMGVSVEKLKDMAKHGKLLSSDVFPKFGAALKNSFQNVDTNNASSAMNQIANSWIKLTKIIGVGNVYNKIAIGFANAFSAIVDNFTTVTHYMIDIVATMWVGKMFKTIQLNYNTLVTTARSSYVKQALAAEESAIKQATTNTNMTRKEITMYKRIQVESTTAYATASFNAKLYSNVASVAFNKIGIALKSMMRAFMPMIIIGGIIDITQRIVNYYRELNNAKSIYNNFIIETKKQSNNSDEIIRLKSLMKVYNDKSKSVIEQNNAQKNLLSMLGIEKGSQDQINNKVRERIKLLTQAAEADFLIQSKINAQKSINDIFAKYGGRNEFTKKLNEDKKSKGWATKNIKTDAEIDAERLKQYTKVIKTSDKGIDKNLSASINQNYNVGDVGDVTDNEKHEETDLEKAIKDYDENTKKLYNQKLAGTIKELDYAKDLDDINKKTYEELGGILGKNASKNATFIKAKSGVDNKIYTPELQEKELKTNFNNEKNIIDNNNLAGLYKNNDEYKNAIIELTKSYIENVAKIKDINIASSTFIKELNILSKSLEKNTDYSLPEKQKIDHTFDYKKTDEDKTIDKLNSNDDYIDKLKEKLEKIGDEKGVDNILEKIKVAKGDYNDIIKEVGEGAEQLIDELNDALKNSDNLEKSLKIIELKKDIKDLKSELAGGIYSTTKDITNNVLDLRDAWMSVGDAFQHHESTMQKILSIWNALTSSIDKLLSTIKQLNELNKVYKKLQGAQNSLKNPDSLISNKKTKKGSVGVDLNELHSLNKFDKKDDESDKIKKSVDAIEDLNKAKKVQQVVDNATTANQLTNNQLANASNATAALTNKSTATTNILVNSAETQSNAAKSASALPFPANLIAIASSIAAVVALMNSIPKFENGGVIGGNSLTGDKIIARVNSGEMILNKGQQSTIFGLLNNNNQTSSSEVTFKIEGKTLKGVLDNYNKIKGK